MKLNLKMFISLEQISPFLRNSSKEIILNAGNALVTKMFITALFQLKVPEEEAD